MNRRNLILSLVAVTCLTAAARGNVSPPTISPPLERHAANRNLHLPPLTLDFTRAVVVARPAAGPESKALQVLLEEVERRTLVRWPVTNHMNAYAPAIIVGTYPQIDAFLGPRARRLGITPAAVQAEGYQIVTATTPAGPQVIIAGKDARGMLYGIGHLLRKMHFGPGRAGLMQPLKVTTSPRYPIRGHQLGFRPKPNTYSGWTAAMFDQYIRELALFGVNAIELIPPRSDDAPDSPHFPEPQLDMMRKMSQSCADYGLDVWIWYPALDKDYGAPATVEFALREWGEVFAALPRVDAVFVPGGDPGHTPPELMFPLLQKQTGNLRKYHPHATMWMSPQGFTPEQMDYFFTYLAEEKPEWFAGTVFAPWVNMDLAGFRQRTPPQYRVRFYPDITHTRAAQYPVNDWDIAFGITQGREIVCPRPTDMALIVRRLQPHTDGAITYSEGHHDDVNKVVWSALSWDPDVEPLEILCDYGRLFISERLAEDFAQGILALERNWRGPLLVNDSVLTTLQQFQDMERAATPQDLLNYRFLMALYRAYYDAYVFLRLRYETHLEDRAMEVLRRVGPVDSLLALTEAEDILNRAVLQPVAQDLRTRVFQLAEAQYQTMRAKLNLGLYRAVAQGRGNNLDSIDWPLNSALWLKARFAAIRQLPSESARREAIKKIVDWTNPGPGGFYDNLGVPGQQPHLVRGLGYEEDPNFIRSAIMTHSTGAPGGRPQRYSQMSHAGTLGDFPLTLRYTGLDPTAEYQVKVTYAADEFRPGLRFTANERHELQIITKVPTPGEPVTLDLPRALTAQGTLTLQWVSLPGRGGSGRGFVSEVWLTKKPVPVPDVHRAGR